MISFFLIFLQLKELEQENEDIRLRNLRRVRTEEKLHTSSENCQENGDKNSSDEKVGYQSICGYNFLSWFDLVVDRLPDSPDMYSVHALIVEVQLFVTGVKINASGVTAVLHTDKITLSWHIKILLLKHAQFNKFQILKFKGLINITGSLYELHFVKEEVYIEHCLRTSGFET